MELQKLKNAIDIANDKYEIKEREDLFSVLKNKFLGSKMENEIKIKEGEKLFSLLKDNYFKKIEEGEKKYMDASANAEKLVSSHKEELAEVDKSIEILTNAYVNKIDKLLKDNNDLKNAIDNFKIGDILENENIKKEFMSLATEMITTKKFSDVYELKEKLPLLFQFKGEK